VLLEHQGVGQHAHGFESGRLAETALQVADGSRAYASALGQRLLRELAGAALVAQEIAEGRSIRRQATTHGSAAR
jgi:hypothetical protein